ncbi:DNA gyrase subunit A [Nocardioides sp. 616]|uniref:DNA gyrase subunit A n=1 Tax=Nocardioides sp. 616 TaxID=2268090 RepID=UPI000CE433DD|nr:DNA gyrase subunit A [Nocardioides sp. 616]
MRDRDSEISASAQLQLARDELLVVEAVEAAASNAHGVLDVLLTSSDAESAVEALQEQFGLTQIQAHVVMDMQFRRVTQIERRKFRERCEALIERIRDIEAQTHRS